jgi:hypothetical protein
MRNAARLPDVTVVDVRPGLGVVGLSRDCCGYQGSRPPRLLITQNMRTWRDITPAQARRPDPGHGYPFFESASFISPVVGWVESWNPGTVKVTIYRTVDGGASWTASAAGTHTASAGGITVVDALSASTAYRETLEPTGPGEDLAVTQDGGVHWQSVYNGPSPTTGHRPLDGPFEMEPTFLSSTTGFASDGLPQADPVSGPAHGDLFMTVDGGRRWARLHLPRVQPCRSSDYPVTTSCPVGLPSFSGPEQGVVPYVSRTPRAVIVGFDTSNDDGRTWVIGPHLHFRMPRLGVESFDDYVHSGTYPLVSVASADVWWVAEPERSGTTIWRTSDAGGTWSVEHGVRLNGQPEWLQTTSTSDAWLTELVGRPNHQHDLLFLTSDGGRDWHRVPAIDDEPADR